MILEIITPPDHTPVSNGSGVIGSIPGIFMVSDAKISAGNITDIKLISTILIENRNTTHGIIPEFVPDSVFSAFLCFANPFDLDFGCLKFEW